MRNMISLVLLFSSLISHAQQELPSGAIQRMNRGKDSLQLRLETKNSLSTIRTSARSEGKNVLLLSSTARNTKDQFALYFGELEKKPVYKVNTSTIVSKYAGEVEKNLENLFANAASKQWVLFFDEADQLFSKSNQPAATAKYIEKLALDKNVVALFWCEDDCRTWLRNSKYAAVQ